MKLRQWLTGLPTLLYAGIHHRSRRFPLSGAPSPTKACIGRQGEAIARRYLRKNGWRIIAKNVHLGQDELDILAMSKDEQTLAIVEVRSTVNPLKKPELTITGKKKVKMLRVARQLHAHAIRHACVLRVDIIAVQLANKEPEVVHYEGVFPLQRARNMF